MTAETVLESALRRDRLIVTMALIAVTLVAWAYVLAGAGTGMSPSPWPGYSPKSMSEAAPGAMDGDRPALGEAASGMAAMPGMTPAGEGSGDRSAAAMPKEAMAAGDIDIADMGMMTPAAWTPGYVVLMFFMWWAMMVAMMLPSATPMILLFATVNRKQRARADPFVPTSVFAGAYLVTWGGFSLVAVGLQWTLQRSLGSRP